MEPFQGLGASSILATRSSIKLSGILSAVSAALRATLYGNTGSPRKARLAKKRFVSFAIF